MPKKETAQKALQKKARKEEMDAYEAELRSIRKQAVETPRQKSMPVARGILQAELTGRMPRRPVVNRLYKHTENKAARSFDRYLVAATSGAPEQTLNKKRDKYTKRLQQTVEARRNMERAGVPFNRDAGQIYDTYLRGVHPKPIEKRLHNKKRKTRDSDSISTR